MPKFPSTPEPGMISIVVPFNARNALIHSSNSLGTRMTMRLSNLITAWLCPSHVLA